MRDPKPSPLSVDAIDDLLSQPPDWAKAMTDAQQNRHAEIEAQLDLVRARLATTQRVAVALIVGITGLIVLLTIAISVVIR